MKEIVVKIKERLSEFIKMKHPHPSTVHENMRHVQARIIFNLLDELHEHFYDNENFHASAHFDKNQNEEIGTEIVQMDIDLKRNIESLIKLTFNASKHGQIPKVSICSEKFYELLSNYNEERDKMFTNE